MKRLAIYLWAAIGLMAFAAPADATLHHGLRSARHMARVFAQPDAQVSAPCGPTGNPSPCSPNQSAFFGFANNNRGAPVNGGLAVQTAGKAAFDIPFSGSNPISWVYCHQGVYDNNVPQGWTGNNQAAAQATNCSSSACTASSNGGARFIEVSSPTFSTTASQNNELLISGLTTGSGANLSQPSGFTAPHTGIILTPGKAYTICLIQYLTDSAFSGELYVYALDTSGANAPGSPSITTNNAATGAQGFYRGGSPFNFYSASTIGPLFMAFGTTTGSVTSTYEAGSSGPMGNILMASGVFPNTGGVPTLSALQALATGAQDPAAWMSANGLTPQALYRLNDAGAGTPWKDSSGLNQTALAPVNSGYPPVASSPIVPPAALVISEFAEDQLFRVTPGQTGPTATGPVPISGTYNPSVLAAGVKGIQCAVLKAGVPQGSGWTRMAASAGVFSGQVTGVTQGVGYTRACRFTNSRAYSFQGAYHIRVGLLVGLIGQSEIEAALNAQTGATSGTGANLQAAGSLGIVTLNLSDPLSTSSPYVPNLGTGHVGLIGIDANNSPGSNSTGSSFVPCGDGCLAFLNGLAAASGMPVESVWLAKDGNPVDSFVYDNMAVSASVTGTGGQTTWTNQGLAFSASTNIPSAAFVAGFVASIKEGSLQIFDSGNHLIASDVQATPFHLNTICTWTSGATSMTCTNTTGIAGAAGAVNVLGPTGPNSGSVTTVSSVSGLTVNLSQATNTTGTNALTEFTSYGALSGGTVSSGSVNYTGDTFTATFSSAPSTPLTVKWTNVEDTQAATYIKHVPYVGYGTTGDRTNPTSGFVTQIWSQVQSPLSMVLFSQCNANSGDVASVTGSGNTAGLASMNAKWDYYFSTVLPQFSGWDPATPIVSLGYQRNTTGPPTVQATAGCVYFLQQYAAHAHPTLPAPIYWGGDYPDYAVQQSGNLYQSPHPTFGPLGGARQARRWAVAANDVAGGQGLPNPTITSSAFSGTNNVNIDVTFSMPAALSGASLATCGANLSGGTNTAPPGAINGGASTCSVTTSAGSASCQGFRVGLTNSLMYNSYGVDENNTTSSAYNAIMAATGVAGSSNTFSCTVTSATTVRLTNTGTWSWAAGTVFVSYGAEGPAALSGEVYAIAITPGSGYTPGTYSFTTSTSTCSTFPKVFVHVSAGGAIDDAYINTAGGSGTIGAGCTNPQTVTLGGMGAGTGGAVTLSIGTEGSDLNDLGQFLYANDNSTAYGGNTYEPGLPVRRCVVPFQVGAAVAC
ncbi:MAG TPA: hypothetical protein VFE18_04995 [Phenylobacterium sp.]|jgi:hypothetical protein|uniref:hypothetical protein n=1 Tax=Phenylobacterium sp. TaxID=1871053 RepID=UPI002D6B3656|nr:hypothetical protein [Phenylobacterium sp.]HZZ67510.1 hypothetical protein [Phenylobacterium sp.]